MTLIERDEELPRVIEALAPLDRITLDTEFLWERTYLPRLALVQVAGRDPAGKVHAFAVDPLAVDVAPLVAFLAEPRRVKVLHDARIDLQIFARLTPDPLRPIFDSQRAASLVGFGPQVGYAALVAELTGKELPKAEQYSDWTRRPLRQSQIVYALGDVVPLLDVHDRLVGLLEQTGRAGWAEMEMASLMAPETYEEPSDRDRYLKLKGRTRLDRQALAVLRELCAWREKTARQLDLRPGFVVKDVALLELAARAPKKPRELATIRGLHPAELKRHGEGIVRAVQRALSLPRDEWPGQERRRVSKLDLSGAVDLLRAFLRQKAAETGVAAEVIATTADLEELAKAHARGADPHEQPVMQGWRGALVGQDLLRLLEGRVALGIDERGALQVVRPSVDIDHEPEGSE